MRFLLSFLFCASSCLIYAQNTNNYLQLDVNTPLSFVLNDGTDLDNSVTLSNALTISLRTQTTCTVYARISAFSGPSGFVPSGYPFKLDYVSTTSTNANIIETQPLTLLSTDQALFSQTKTGGNIREYYYNFILNAPGYTYPPGFYSFTMQFTMTQP